MRGNQFLTMRLSTAHLTPKTRELLNKAARDPYNSDVEEIKAPVFSKGELGWFVFTDCDKDEPRKDLQACLEYARRNGSELVIFDSDEVPVMGLLVYEEETEAINELKNDALWRLSRLRDNVEMYEGDFEILRNAVLAIDTIAETDARLKEMWMELEDIPMDPETETMEEPFYNFPSGTPREMIWHWFDERYSKGVAALLYGENEECVAEAKSTDTEPASEELECTTMDCAYNCDGLCKYCAVKGRMPAITEEDGCLNGVIDLNGDADRAPELNTRIDFLYRDASNCKIFNRAVVRGILTPEEHNEIISCLEDGKFFIPAQVGLEGVRFGDENEDDHPWFELGWSSFSVTDHKPYNSCLDANELLEKFRAAKGHWDPEFDFTKEDA